MKKIKELIEILKRIESIGDPADSYVPGEILSVASVSLAQEAISRCISDLKKLLIDCDEEKKCKATEEMTTKCGFRKGIPTAEAMCRLFGCHVYAYDDNKIAEGVLMGADSHNYFVQLYADEPKVMYAQEIASSLDELKDKIFEKISRDL